ncbi:MAG: helix-turn-helix domain-containing protein [Reyranellaceae bacterium]
MYHYTESGLDNVWLVNGYTKHKTSYGDGMSFKNVEKLHAAIVDSLVRKPGRLSGREFRFLRLELGLSQKALAELVETDENGIGRWERGVSQVPAGVDRLIRAWCQERFHGSAAIEDMLKTLAQSHDTADAPIRLRLRGGWKLAA